MIEKELPVAEALIVEDVGIIGILAEKLLQVDAGLVEAAGCEELQGTGEVVVHEYRVPMGRWLLLLGIKLIGAFRPVG
jgi:hypothetical protein